MSDKVEMLNQELDKLQNEGLELQGDKDRDLLIMLGAWGRSKNPDFWVEQFAKAVLESDTEIVICDDVRFPNEAKFFEDHGLLFRIEGEQRGDNVDKSRADAPSETALDEYKFQNVIKNDIEPALMCRQIAEVMQDGS